MSYDEIPTCCWPTKGAVDILVRANEYCMESAEFWSTLLYVGLSIDSSIDWLIDWFEIFKKICPPALLIFKGASRVTLRALSLSSPNSEWWSRKNLLFKCDEEKNWPPYLRIPELRMFFSNKTFSMHVSGYWTVLVLSNDVRTLSKPLASERKPYLGVFFCKISFFNVLLESLISSFPGLLAAGSDQ